MHCKKYIQRMNGNLDENDFDQLALGSFYN